jgi:thiol-disulfide isomerase/thioredoxin
MIKAFLILLLSFGLTLAAPKPGSQAPDFSLPDLFHNNATHSLSEKLGKVVLVDFWASWCAPCRISLPELGKIRNRNPSLVVLALSIDEDKSRAMAFLKSHDSNITYLHDEKQSTAKGYNLGGMPSAYLIDKSGILRYRLDGYGESDLKKLELEIKKLMEEKP